MFPDDKNSNPVGNFYVLDESKQEWIKIGNLAINETIGQKECLKEVLAEN